MEIQDQSDLFDDNEGTQGTAAAAEPADAAAAIAAAEEGAPAPAAGTPAEPLPGNTTPPAPIIPEGTPSAEGTEGATPAEGTAPEPVNTDGVELSGLELFLSDYGIEGGMIKFDDGQSVHIDELSAAEQSVVLSNLAKEARPTVEAAFDLDESEIGIINMARESGKKIDDFIADLANAQMEKIRTMNESQSVDWDNMSDDAVYLAFLQKENPDMTQEELDEDLANAKETRTYANITSGLRTNFKNEQEAARAANDAKINEEFDKNVEKDRRTLVEYVAPVEQIAGFELNDDNKNELLADMIELNDVGDSKLLENVFSSPENILKTAWFLKYGESSINEMETYWKTETSKAYARGKAEALGRYPQGTQPEKIGGVRPTTTTGPPSAAPGDVADIQDLYLDDE